MAKINCWEHFGCGREPGGINERELGTCPAAVQKNVNGINDGINGGRSCWAVAGTMCKGKVQGSYAQKLGDCLRCNFFASVRDEQGDKLVSTRDILIKINGSSH